MKQIPRHLVDNVPFIAKELEFTNKNLEKNIAFLPKKQDNLGLLSSKTLFRAMNIAVLAERSIQEIINYMKLTLALGIAHFQSVRYPGETIEITLPNQQVQLQGKATTANIDSTRWVVLFHLAVILRDQAAIQTLSQVPEALLKQANVKGDQTDFALVRFYKGLYDAEANIGELLVSAMEATDPKYYNYAPRVNYLLDIVVPTLVLYRCIFSQVPDEFNTKLVEALERHKTYWGTKDRAKNTEGWVALPLVTASVIAHEDKEYPIEVESPYLPLWLVQGAF